MSEVEVPRGLTGVIVDSTAIATTDKTGNLVYRGYRAVDLADKYSLGEIAYLVVNGELPSQTEYREFDQKYRSMSHPEERARKVAETLREKNLMTSLRTLVSAHDPDSSDLYTQLLDLIAKMPWYASDSYRIYRNLPYLEDLDLPLSEKMCYLLTGSQDREKAKFLEKILIMYMEHEFNASTFALRVAASTETDPVSAFDAALATLKGPLHGGANGEVLTYLLKFKDEEEGIEFVDNKLARKELVMGFGHRVYKTKDPRAQFIKESLRKMIGDTQRFQIAEAIENHMWENKNLPANLDFYGAFYLHELGIDEALYTALFACSRAFGWMAHYLEQIANNKLIRPLARYTGHPTRELDS